MTRDVGIHVQRDGPQSGYKQGPSTMTEEPKPEEAVEKPMSRTFRLAADNQADHPAVTIYDSRGRPKEKSNRHKWIGNGAWMLEK